MQSYAKILRKMRQCTGCDKKETGCTRVSSADTLDRHQVGNGVHGRVQVGEWSGIDLILIDATCRVKISDAYYREVLLTQKLLLVMREVCGEFFIFQQGNVPAHPVD